MSVRIYIPLEGGEGNGIDDKTSNTLLHGGRRNGNGLDCTKLGRGLRRMVLHQRPHWEQPTPFCLCNQFPNPAPPPTMYLVSLSQVSFSIFLDTQEFPSFWFMLSQGIQQLILSTHRNLLIISPERFLSLMYRRYMPRKVLCLRSADHLA